MHKKIHDDHADIRARRDIPARGRLQSGDRTAGGFAGGAHSFGERVAAILTSHQLARRLCRETVHVRLPRTSRKTRSNPRSDTLPPSAGGTRSAVGARAQRLGFASAKAAAVCHRRCPQSPSIISCALGPTLRARQQRSRGNRPLRALVHGAHGRQRALRKSGTSRLQRFRQQEAGHIDGGNRNRGSAVTCSRR